MKRINFKVLLISALVVIVAFAGCKKSDDEENTFTFENRTFKIDLCALDFNGEIAQDTFEYKLFISTKGAEFDELVGGYVGSCDKIQISLVSTDGENIKPGYYTFDPFEEKDDYSGFNVSVSIREPEYLNLNYIHSVKSGIIKLRRAGNKFKIDFEIYVTKIDHETLQPEESEEQYPIKGYYEGSVKEHDLTAK